MRQSSFEKPVDESESGASTSTDVATRHDRRDRIGAWLVAISAFVCWYQRGNPPSGVNLESSWFDVLSRAFTQGWQWGSDIIFTYGPLGFLTPYLTWNPETASAFRIGQIVLCLLSPAMAIGFYPVNADTSKKADHGQKGVSCPSEESSAKSSSVRLLA